jgi:predicted cupin superfamily sugar epimerase
MQGKTEEEMIPPIPPGRMSAGEVIDLIGLEPLPGEGGVFRQTYRSADVLPPET